MDKISKALKKLTRKERKAVEKILVGIEKEELTGFDIKKLKGREDIFRVRKGVIRIIFRKTDAGIFVLSVERRSDRTYK